MKVLILTLLTCISCFILTCCSESETIDYGTDYPTIPNSGKLVKPRLTSLEFLASDNPESLIEDAVCTITGDSVADCWVSHLMDDFYNSTNSVSNRSGKQLIARFTFDGDCVRADDRKIESGITPLNFSRPRKITVIAGEMTKDYTVYVHAFTGLPVLWIETEDRAPITSKDNYVPARFCLVEDVVTRSPGDVIETIGQIKGRGNTSWSMPKKPYRLKFSEKVSLLGEPADKSWVLLANYSDKTMLRNATAFYMGEMSNIGYTPRSHFVEVILNGSYDGTYQLCEKLKISKHRVNVGDDGFLMEIDEKENPEENPINFRIKHIRNPIYIKDPDVKPGDDSYNYAKDFMVTADSVLFSANFMDPEEGWQKYIDMDSFVDWYLVNEIAKNNDAIFFSSCYMNLARGGKVRMGPLWDFDIAFGNINYGDNFDVSGFWIRVLPWFNRLFQDPAFVARVKEHFDYFYNHRDNIFNEINLNARYLHRSVQENENRWGILYNTTWPNYDVWGNYQNEVQNMKGWLSRRLDWLKANL